MERLLKENPLPWLLEPQDPSIRYWTLTDIKDLEHENERV